MILCAKMYFVKKVGSMLVVVFESGFFVLNIDRFVCCNAFEVVCQCFTYDE